jgi:hypothetical protein
MLTLLEHLDYEKQVFFPFSTGLRTDSSQYFRIGAMFYLHPHGTAIGRQAG